MTQIKITNTEQYREVITSDESILPLSLDIDEGNIRATYYDGQTVDFKDVDEFIASHRIEVDYPETACFAARLRAELTEEGEHRARMISSRADLRTEVADQLSAIKWSIRPTAADEITDVIHYSDYRPNYGEDWGAFLANLDWLNWHDYTAIPDEVQQ